METAFK